MDTLDPQAWGPLPARGRGFGALDPARRQAPRRPRSSAGAALCHRGNDDAGLFRVLEGALTIRAPVMAQRQGMLAPGQGRRSVGVRQEHPVAMLSLTRQTVRAVLRALATEGSIRRGDGAIRLVDPLAQQRPSASR